MPALRILLADDHTLVRQGLRKVLEDRPEWQVVAEAGDGRAAVRLAEEYKPDVAVMEKLNLHSAAEIVLYAVRRGVVR
jgi:two-component system, NarL family, response regulator NreC